MRRGRCNDGGSLLRLPYRRSYRIASEFADQRPDGCVDIVSADLHRGLENAGGDGGGSNALELAGFSLGGRAVARAASKFLL